MKIQDFLAKPWKRRAPQGRDHGTKHHIQRKHLASGYTLPLVKRQALMHARQAAKKAAKQQPSPRRSIAAMLGVGA